MATRDLFNLIKRIVDNYMWCRKPAAILIGTYTGKLVQIGTLPVPAGKLSGNMMTKLTPGDKVRLLRNDGGSEYYVLEIIGKPYKLEQDCPPCPYK